jgi:hypothetical protein
MIKIWDGHLQAICSFYMEWLNWMVGSCSRLKYFETGISAEEQDYVKTVQL